MRPGETNQNRAMFSVGNPSEKFTIRVKVYGGVKIYRSSESLLTGWTYYYPSGNIVIRVEIWSSEWNCRPGENIPSKKITIGTKTCRLNKIVPSEWKYSHPSGKLSSEWKSPIGRSEWKYLISEWMSSSPSEIEHVLKSLSKWPWMKKCSIQKLCVSSRR